MRYPFSLLIVEDDKSYAETLIEKLKPTEQNIEITHTESANSAIEIIKQKENVFDLILLDLKLPTQTNGFDTSPDHGMSVFHECKAQSPGTPIVVLTGSGDNQYTNQFLQGSENLDIWGEGRNRPSVSFFPKSQLADCLQYLKGCIQAVQALGGIEIPRDAPALSKQEDRLTRIFAKLRNDMRVEVRKLGGGLSGSNVLKVDLFDQNGHLDIATVSKIGPSDDIKDEQSRYRSDVQRLPPHFTPRSVELFKYGAKDKFGLFYSLAHGCDDSFFGKAKAQELQDRHFIEIKASTQTWSDTGTNRTENFSEYRKQSITDQKLDLIREKLPEYDLNKLDTIPVLGRWSCTHGDLHGENILINARENKINLIDFGDVGHGPACIDPLTLEFSFFFHPEGLERGTWPTMEQAENWLDLDRYLIDCRIPNTIRFCREWAEEVAGGERALAATAYGYFARQLKYDDTDVELVAAFLKGCEKAFE